MNVHYSMFNNHMCVGCFGKKGTFNIVNEGSLLIKDTFDEV